MRNRYTALFIGVFELDIASFSGHLEPFIPLKGRDNFPTFHGVYKYTLFCICQTLFDELVPTDCADVYEFLAPDALARCCENRPLGTGNIPCKLKNKYRASSIL